ncbi:MAG: DUF4349 domain-containing protein [Bacteroides sp.]|nr:DUF4349 domain-containing protein [Prevotella sp.]MCM1407006.1 DUF4349 domain-containing protein [Treponema brennaborense]MCM1470157.1 DUF4349 domain-containing protein [Bacteroides sp.]
MKKNTQMIIAAMLLCAGLAFVSCGKGAAENTAVMKSTETFAVPRMAAQKTAARTEAAADFAAMAAPAPAAESAVYGAGNIGNIIAEDQETQNDGGYERKLIKSGSLSLEVKNLAEAEAAAESWCTAFGGYIASSNSGERSAYFSARIPSNKFESAMAAAGNIGTVLSRAVSAQDVSEQFYDLQTRLETRKIMRDRLRTYLAQAKDVKDMLQIERELNSVLSDIESMEGRMKRLSGQIEYSTIDVNISLPYRTTSGGFEWPNLGAGFRRFVSNVVDFFGGFIKVLLYIAVCGIPLGAVIAFFWWLLFGKIGLLKKLYKRLSR